MPELVPNLHHDYLRVFARRKCDRRLKIIFHHAGKPRSANARCTNVGNGGFCARLPHQLELGQLVSVEFLLQGIAVSLRAAVRHTQGFDTGFQFVAPGEDERKVIAQLFMEGLHSTEE